MGLFGNLVSLDADGEHVHPLEEESETPQRPVNWFARLIAALRRWAHR